MISLKEFSKNAGFALALSIQTPHSDEWSTYNLVNIHLFEYSWWFKIPNIVKTKKVWVPMTSYHRAYERSIRREFGISFTEDGMHVRYGAQPGEWISGDPANSDKSWFAFYPWNLEFDQHTIFDVDQIPRYTGDEWTALIIGKYSKDAPFSWHPDIPYDMLKMFDYYDAANDCYVKAKANIEEREWHRGRYAWMRCITRHFKWGRCIRRDLAVEFSEEVGHRKGSWKGGTIRCSLTMLKGETMDQAIARFQTSWN